MQRTPTRPDISKLKERLRRLRIASCSAIEQGDCRAVARFTCEAVRLQDFIDGIESHAP